MFPIRRFENRHLNGGKYGEGPAIMRETNRRKTLAFASALVLLNLVAYQVGDAKKAPLPFYDTMPERRINAANCAGVAGWAFEFCSAQSNATEADCNKVQRDTEADCLNLSQKDASPHVVSVYADGTFSPAELYIKDGDTVLWSFYNRGESVLPVDVPLIPVDEQGNPRPSVCTAYKAYDPDDPNEFTGPMRRAVSGIYVLNPEREPGDTAIPDAIDPALRDADFTGVFLRFKWSDVHLGPGTYNWEYLDHQVDEAVQNNKMFSLTFKAGQRCGRSGRTKVCDGTPGWIFDSDITEASAAEALQLMGAPTSPRSGSCGAAMQLGSPADPNYRAHYFELLKAVAAHLMEKNAWYQSLAYIKPSGANLFSAEARLPHRCWSNTETGLTADKCDCVEPRRGTPPPADACVCNPQVWSVEGRYTPAALYEFYSLQAALLAREFPEKDMSYMLIQAGFPIVNDAGEYEYQDVVDDHGNYSPTVISDRTPVFPFPGGTEQTEQIIERGAEEHGTRFAVQHNGLRELHHKPNRWVRRLANEELGLFTGYQTRNDLPDPDIVGSTFANALGANAVFIEVYQKDLLNDDGSAVASFDGKSLGTWDNEFHAQRRKNKFRQKAKDPFPFVHGHTFHRTLSSSRGNQALQYVVTPWCKENPRIGTIYITPD
jgi:hypothetical protein